MSTPVRITGGNDAGQVAHVTALGQIVVAPLAYDDVVFQELATANVAFNFFGPKSGMRFVITGIRLRADRDVSVTIDATVIIYEASSATATTVDKVIFEENMVRGESVSMLPLNILATEGVWINGKTTDDDIFCMVMGYYVNA